LEDENTSFKKCQILLKNPELYNYKTSGVFEDKGLISYKMGEISAQRDEHTSY